MPAVGPITDSELLKRDTKSGQDGIVYLVTLSTGNLDPLHEPGLPALNSRTHPFDPNLKADRYEIAEWVIPGLQCKVRVLYSNDGRFSLPTQPNTGDPNFRTWESTQATVVMKIPRLVKRPLLKGCVAGGGGGPQFSWVRQDFQTVIPTERVERRLNWNTYKLAERLAIRAQLNKYHLLDPDSPQGQDNPLFKFLGADVRQVGVDLWEYVYRWETEAGNRPPDPIIGPGSDDVILPFEYRDSFQVYQVLGPDLSGVDVCNVTAVNALRPRIIVVTTYGNLDVVPRGAVNLPGRPLSD